MTSRFRMWALVAFAMTALAFATTAEQRDLTVVPTSQTIDASIVTDAAPWIGNSPSHTDNFQAFWACAASRPSEEHTVTHAHPTGLDPRYVTASCISRAEDLVCNWAAILWWNGQVSRASNYHCTIVG